MGGVSEPKKIAGLVDYFLRQKMASSADLTPIAMAYGDAVSTATGWKWGIYALGNTQHLALVSADQAHAHLPLPYIATQSQKSQETTALLLFNMLAAGNLPPTRGDSLEVIG